MGGRDPGRLNAAELDERRRLSALDLVGLAAGGVIGSGWLLAGESVYRKAGAGPWSVGAWVVGGLVMLLIAAVMVELGITAPKTGGLIFLPLQAAGPLVATVVAAGLWTVYAMNPPSEAAAMVQGIGHWFPSLLRPGELDEGVRLPGSLTRSGGLVAVLFLTLIIGLNLLPLRKLIRFNLIVTVVKVVIPVLIVAWLASAELRPGTCPSVDTGRSDPSAVLSTVLGAGVLYAYTGYQAPLDFAGNVRQRGIGEKARLRIAVYGTLGGAFLLYTALQYVFDMHSAVFCPTSPDAPYTQFAKAAGIGWLVLLIRIDALLSPMGAGVVFTHALTREVAALGRAHLTHRGLQTARRASFRFAGRVVDAYWMILLVNLAIGTAALVAVQGNWEELVALNSVPFMMVYAMPGVVLVALGRLLGFHGARAMAHRILGWCAFVVIAVVVEEAGWAKVWRGMAAVGIGSVLLLVLPLLARADLPFAGPLLRRYDARAHAQRLLVSGDPAVPPVLLFLGHLAMLVLCALLDDVTNGGHAGVGTVLAALSAAVVFPLLVRAARRYMDEVPPTLPDWRAGEAPVEPVVSAATR
jgi:amino acid transporter